MSSKIRILSLLSGVSLLTNNNDPFSYRDKTDYRSVNQARKKSRRGKSHKRARAKRK
jgi:hypothetical protein